MSAVQVQRRQNCLSLLSMKLAGLRGMILHWWAQQCSCSQGPWPRCSSVSVALQTASPHGVRMLHGWYSFVWGWAKQCSLYQFGVLWDKFRQEWKGSASLKVVFTPGSHLAAGLLGKWDHQLKEMKGRGICFTSDPPPHFFFSFPHFLASAVVSPAY